MHAAKARVLVLDLPGLRPLTVHIALDHRVPPGRQVLNQLIARVAIHQRKAARHDQRIVVAVFPQAVDHLRHQLQHAARALEVVQRGPVFIQAVEHLGVDRVGVFQPFQILAVLRLGGQVVAVGDVVVRKRPAHRLHRQLIVDVAEQAAAHDLERFLGGHRLPQRLNAPEVMRKRSQRLFTTLAACLLDGLRQRGEQHRRRHRLQGLRQRLHETQVGIEGTTRQRLTFLKLPHIGHQLVDQDHAGRMAAQQIGQHLLARRRARGIGLRHQRVALGPTQLPCQITPQRADALPILDDRLVGRGLDAVQHGDARLGQICHACRIKDGGHALQVAGRCLALGEVIDRQHGVRLATAEGSLQLNDWLAALAIEPLRYLG